MKIHFWGATDEVTGSMTFLETSEGIVMVDSGLYQGDREAELKNFLSLPFPAKSISHVLITHAHLDHTGYLPALVKQGFRGSVHCTKPTKKLMAIILRDSAGFEEEKKLYEAKDVELALSMTKTHEWNEGFNVHDFSVTFFPVGHILGASGIKILTSTGKRIVFSGDLGRPNDPLLLDHEGCPEADVIVMESTYGNRLRKGDLEKDLFQFLHQVSHESRVGLIASFAVARGQLLLKLIFDFFEHHPESRVNLVVDSPMMTEANSVFKSFAHLTKYPHELYEALEKVEVIEHERQWESLKKKKGPLIVLASSGMLTGGRIIRHLRHWSSDEKAMLFLPGYQGESTPGRALTQGYRTIVDEKHGPFTWQGEVQTSDSFSSHADQRELIEWVGEKNAKAKVFLIHGDEEAKRVLSDLLQEKVTHVQAPKRGEKIFL